MPEYNEEYLKLILGTLFKKIRFESDSMKIIEKTITTPDEFGLFGKLPPYIDDSKLGIDIIQKVVNINYGRNKK
jgi:hypothetical protein